MLQVSESARSLLKDILDAQPESNQIFRLDKGMNGLELSLADPVEGDVLFQHDESDVLAVSSEVAESLDGLTIDCEESPEGPRLVLVE